MKRLGSTKLCALVLASVILASVLSLSSAVNPPYSTTIGATGQISATQVTARSGSTTDIQAAVDSVTSAGGGIVRIPEGTFSFIINPNKETVNGNPAGVIITGGISVIGAGKDKTILRMTQPPPSGSSAFFVDGRNGRPTRISGMKLVGNVTPSETAVDITGIEMYCAKDFRIDHISFVDFSRASIAASVYTVKVGGQYYWNHGVIDHIDIDNPYKDLIGGTWAYGILVLGPGRDDAWVANIETILSNRDGYKWLVFIEDSTFSRCRHSIASNGEAWYVARYNTFVEPRPRNYPMIDIHGASGPDSWGGRGAEVYNNTIISASGYYTGCGIDYRGGGGVVFNNVIRDTEFGVRMSFEGTSTNQVCWVDDLWIWNNVYQNVPTLLHDYTNGQAGYNEEDEYFLRERPGYTPYAYPHPLTIET